MGIDDWEIMKNLGKTTLRKQEQTTVSMNFAKMLHNA